MKFIPLAIITLLGILGSGLIMLSGNTSEAESNYAPIIQHHEEVLDNHEARITNLESDTEVLQQNTNTPPAPAQPVPQVNPEPTPPPEESNEEERQACENIGRTYPCNESEESGEINI